MHFYELKPDDTGNATPYILSPGEKCLMLGSASADKNKTFISPNIKKLIGEKVSYICVELYGEAASRTASLAKKAGYAIWEINAKKIERSTKWNPLQGTKDLNEDERWKLAERYTSIILDNNKKAASAASKVERSLLQALIFYAADEEDFTRVYTTLQNWEAEGCIFKNFMRKKEAKVALTWNEYANEEAEVRRTSRDNLLKLLAVRSLDTSGTEDSKSACQKILPVEAFGVDPIIAFSGPTAIYISAPIFEANYLTALFIGAISYNKAFRGAVTGRDLALLIDMADEVGKIDLGDVMLKDSNVTVGITAQTIKHASELVRDEDMEYMHTFIAFDMRDQDSAAKLAEYASIPPKGIRARNTGRVCRSEDFIFGKRDGSQLVFSKIAHKLIRFKFKSPTERS